MGIAEPAVKVKAFILKMVNCEQSGRGGEALTKSGKKKRSRDPI